MYNTRLLVVLYTGFLGDFLRWVLQTSLGQWLGWLQCSTMECLMGHTLTAQGISHSMGCCLSCVVLHKSVLTYNMTHKTQLIPAATCYGFLYSWWHPASPTNRNGSHDCTLLFGPRRFPHSQWCHPTSTNAKKLSCCTQSHHLIWSCK